MTAPEVGFSSPAMMFRSVVFPEPFGPMSPSVLPAGSEMVTPLRAWTPPNSLLTASVRRVGISLQQFPQRGRTPFERADYPFRNEKSDYHDREADYDQLCAYRNGEEIV